MLSHLVHVVQQPHYELPSPSSHGQTLRSYCRATTMPWQPSSPSNHCRQAATSCWCSCLHCVMKICVGCAATFSAPSAVTNTPHQRHWSITWQPPPTSTPVLTAANCSRASAFCVDIFPSMAQKVNFLIYVKGNQTQEATWILLIGTEYKLCTQQFFRLFTAPVYDKWTFESCQNRTMSTAIWTPAV